MIEYVKFTIGKHEKLTIGNLYSNAMKVIDKKNAQQYMRDFVKWSMEHDGYDKPEAIRVFKENLRYFGPLYNKYRMSKISDFYGL